VINEAPRRKQRSISASPIPRLRRKRRGIGPKEIKRAAGETPYPLPQGSYLLQDLSFLGFKLEDVVIEMSIKKNPKAAKEKERKGKKRKIVYETIPSSFLVCFPVVSHASWMWWHILHHGNDTSIQDNDSSINGATRG
jgi:hypothetical protein